MTDLFEDDEVEVIESEDQFNDLEINTKSANMPENILDARRRLESMLEERRLREELDDFVDY